MIAVPLERFNAEVGRPSFLAQVHCRHEVTIQLGKKLEVGECVNAPEIVVVEE